MYNGGLYSKLSSYPIPHSVPSSMARLKVRSLEGVRTCCRARIQNESVTIVRSYYRSYYESNFVGVYSVVTKRVDSVSGYTAVFKIQGHCTLCRELRAFCPILGQWV